MHKAVLLSKGEGNFYFGFHDLVAWNNAGDKLLALRIDDMLTPPNPDVPCDIGYLDKEGKYHKMGETYAYNYPQGARQQWIGKTDLFIVNDKINHAWRSKIYNTRTGECTPLEFPTHVITDDGWAFGLDYARLFRVGGYGYTGLPDAYASENAPSGSGIIKHNVYTDEETLIISVAEVASYQMNANLGNNHYFTHLLLNPSQTRIAFLHRYKLKDGGETTRLMTINTDGSELHCLATGFLSHFDWQDNNHIAIWGRTGSSVEKLRSSLLYRMLPTGLVGKGKKIIKKLLYKPKAGVNSNPGFNWLLFTDAEGAPYSLLAKDVITEDGHPMFCPANRDWMICDTYPDSEGIRTLFLFQYSTQRRVDLGTYKMLDQQPDLDKSMPYLQGVDKMVLKAFSPQQMAFTRSGLHCDLHPRWKGDGTMVAFDSIHEGSRQIYGFDVSDIIKSKDTTPAHERQAAHYGV
ncbi:hypothetical protein [Chitinophaga sancti]|uniref:WD40-like Beta Propeller Repeat n=1 Tax=Chitinophaga sancti TaxID=1004 RepID=A0A1K1QUX1_9BACT|nr:hypothetical protein [Chitinophaga sancti]WQD61973.1 hypothetical protein U0033_29225 [Chitinophaga sancti]WQG92458.1 hypothetical protein SR876_13160 [Chitinophaga sancti]SFW63711.1 hypothetical protein SAMN05661012_03109 [Chitinophaga sancti]